MDALRQVDGWPSGHTAVAVVYPDGACATHGDLQRPFSWASLTKLATAVAVLVASDEGVVSLDDPAGPPGSTVRHLLAHASGLPLDGDAPVAAPGTRRIYSNAGFEALAMHIAEAAGMPFAEYFESVWGFPLGGLPAPGSKRHSRSSSR